MSIMLARQIHPQAFDHIREENEKREKAAIAAGGDTWQKYSDDLQKQEDFLDAFEQTFHVGHSIKKAGAVYSEYKKWRSTSINFVERFNDIIEMWHDEIFTSAAMKARGHKAEDDDGNPVFYDADASMQKMFLKSMYPQFQDKMDVNMTGGLNNTTTPLDEERYAEVRKQMLKQDDC